VIKDGGMGLRKHKGRKERTEDEDYLMLGGGIPFVFSVTLSYSAL
jgi:hypothetical protein